MAAICQAAGIDHGVFVGTNIPYIWTIDLCLTLPWVKDPSRSACLVSVKPLESERYLHVDPLDRGPEKLEAERRYARALNIPYFVGDRSIFPGPLFAELEVLAEAANLPASHPWTNTLNRFLDAHGHDIPSFPLCDVVAKLQKDFAATSDQAAYLLNHMLWHQIIDCDLSMRVKRTLDIRPTLEMRRELLDKGIKLTRANLTRWLMNKGKVAVSLIGADEARTKLLLGTSGTFTQYGIKLLRPDRGEKREFIEPIKYVSNHPLILEKVMKAKVGRSRVSPLSHDDDFLYDPYKPTEIYYRNHNDGELIRLELRTKDEDLTLECAYHDILNKMQSDSLYRFEARAAAEKALSNMEAGQEKTKQEASGAYDDAMEELEKPPSKAALRCGKKENREREKELYRNGMPIQMPPGAIEGSVQPAGVSSVNLASDDVAQVNCGQAGGNGEPPKIDVTPPGNARPANSAILQSILARRRREASHEL